MPAPPCCVLEPTEPEVDSPTDGGLTLDGLTTIRNPASPGDVRHEALEKLRQLILGFDVEPAEVRRLAADWPLARDGALRGAEDELLGLFVDVHSLFESGGMEDDSDGQGGLSAHEYLIAYLRTLDAERGDLPEWFVERLRRALAHHGVPSLERSAALEESLARLHRAHQRVDEQVPVVMRILERRLDTGPMEGGDRSVRGPGPHGRARRRSPSGPGRSGARAALPLARSAALRADARRRLPRRRKRAWRLSPPASPVAPSRSRWLVDCSQPLVGLLCPRLDRTAPLLRRGMLEVLVRRYYRIRDLEGLESRDVGGRTVAVAEYGFEHRRIHLLATHAEWTGFRDAARALAELIADVPAEHDVVVDFFVWRRGAPPEDPDAVAAAALAALLDAKFPRRLRRIVVMIATEDGLGIGDVLHFTYRPDGDGYREERLYRGLHPMMGKRLQLWRLRNFEIERLPSVEDVYLFRAVARENPKDERLFALAEVRDLTPVRDAAGQVAQLPHLERMLAEALAGIRLHQAQRPPDRRLYWNRVLLHVWPPLTLSSAELDHLIRKLAPGTTGLGLEKVVLRARIPDAASGELRDTVLQVTNPAGRGFTITAHPPAELPIRPLTEYAQKVVRLRRLGLTYPYEVIRMLTPPDGQPSAFPPGEFVEHELDATGRLVPVQRPPGSNTANLVVGVIRNRTASYPEGMTRVCLLGDPSRSMGALAEAECRRIIAALDLAEALRVPLEWFAVSAGAKISMESGTENMDWIARVLRRLIEFTQAGGEVNVVVAGINVGAQPYWNAEATMLQHTRGILIMTPAGAMVLTGKRALDYSGGVSADDNFGIGGYDRIMGPNGQAQYWAHDLAEASEILFRHYEHAYVAPGECFPRRKATADPVERDVRESPHGDAFARVGDIFSDEHNPGRKRPFEIRKVMAATIDQDRPPLERWAAMRDAEVAVVWDAHLGGHPVCLLGIESRPVPRLGVVPADGPEQWTAGTLFPRASKKVARAINAASGNRPVVVLANLSGFDGSPESLRELQLEYGAEIGRAVVNFDGPIVFCVISRYHGGAYVVFSSALNESVEIAAVEGSYASVIGGAPAAAVVFAGDVDARTRRDPRVATLEAEIAATDGPEKARRRAALAEAWAAVHAEKLGEVAREFDRVHSVYRAQQVGSLQRIIPAATLRPYLIDAVARGMQRTLEATRPRTTEYPAA